MKNPISEYENFFSRRQCAQFLRLLFDRQSLWENRASYEKPPYRNGSWFTLGASVYMDLPTLEYIPLFKQKTEYFNTILHSYFNKFYRMFLGNLNMDFLNGEEPYRYLNDVYPSPLPGFHIFPPEETLSADFAKVHVDRQWRELFALPKFPFKVSDAKHFTFTLPLCLPYQGGGMNVPNDDYVKYKEGTLYMHSGQFPHQVRCLESPVTPLDWRITFQGHGFTIDNKSYLYW